MARRQTALALLAAGASLALAGCGPREFRVSGTITVASYLQTRIPKENGVLFIVAKNLGGVPYAVRRVVNPMFPVTYTLTGDDLVVPGSHPKDALRVTVEMNTHGNVGQAQRGDLAGEYPDVVYPGERRVHIVIDRRL
jgi:cytochrome c-type biogenesis protein CcmH